MTYYSIRTILLQLLLVVIIGNSYAQKVQKEDKEPHTIIINNTTFQILQVSETHNRDFLSIEDTSAFRIIDTLLRIHKSDTFNVHRYYKYGKLIRESEYDMNGILRGIWNWNNGKLHGVSFTFDSNQRLTSMTNWDNWNLIHSIDIDSLGNLVHFHINDSLTQKSWGREYYGNGTLKAEESALWENGHHKDIRYYENGQVMIETISNAGCQKGMAYYEDGTLMEEYYFIDLTFLLVGRLAIYYPDGKLNHEAFYQDGVTRDEAGIRTGTWSWWDENGKLIKQEVYKNNSLIDEKIFGNSNLKEKQ